MEIGRVAEIDNSKLNSLEKTQKVSEVDENKKVIQEDEYKKTLGTKSTDKNEVILDNVRFGYNRSSKDFFVKVTRGEAEYKYLNEDMMKVKAYIMQELESSN